MKNRISQFLIVSSILFVVVFFIHQYLLDNTSLKTELPLLKMYFYHSISGAIVYTVIEFVFSKLPNQAGFVFLASVFIKIGFFILIFSSNLFNTSLQMFERLSVIIPFFTFLFLEAIYSFRLLNKS